MTRYFFDTADGETDTDQTGVELAGDDEAIDEAIRYAGALIRDDPVILATKREFIVSVRRDDASAFARIHMQLERPVEG